MKTNVGLLVVLVVCSRGKTLLPYSLQKCF